MTEEAENQTEVEEENEMTESAYEDERYTDEDGVKRLTRTGDTEKLADVLNEEEEVLIVSFHLRKESDEHGKFVVPTASVERIREHPETIGVLTLQVVQASGDRAVVLGTSKDEDRLKIAAELGAKETIIVDDIKNGEK